MKRDWPKVNNGERLGCGAKIGMADASPDQARPPLERILSANEGSQVDTGRDNPNTDEPMIPTRESPKFRVNLNLY